MESAARVLQNECPYSAARELFLSRDSVRRGHNPFSHHERHRLFQLPEECGAGVWVSFKFIALSSLSAAPHNLGGGVYLTNRFESCNFLKMLINEQEKGPRKHQNADMTRDAFEPVQRDVAYLSGNFPSTLCLLEDATSTWAPGYHNSCVNGKTSFSFSFFCSTIYCYKLSK